MEKETRYQQIRSKIFSKNDIQRIARVFIDEFKNMDKEEYPSKHLTFSIDCEGGISYKSDSISIFDDDGYIDTKRINTIQMTISNDTLWKVIDLIIVRGNSHVGEFGVTGSDRNWVKGTFTTLQEIIDSVTPQKNSILQYKWLWACFIYFGIASVGYLCGFLTTLWSYGYQLSDFGLNLLGRNTAGVLEIKRFFGITLIFGFFFTHLILKWLINLWSDVEFNFGPEHLNIDKIRREKLYLVLSLLIIPIITDIIFALIWVY